MNASYPQGFKLQEHKGHFTVSIGKETIRELGLVKGDVLWYVVKDGCIIFSKNIQEFESAIDVGFDVKREKQQ